MVLLNFFRNAKVRLFLSRVLLKLHIVDRMVIVRMDGGICSQIHFYLIGQYYRNKGYKVKYDLSWYEYSGKGLDGSLRDFVLDKAFPNIYLPRTSKVELYCYREFSYKGNYFDDSINYKSLEDKKPPLYLDGYYLSPRSLFNNVGSVLPLDYSVLSGMNEAALKKIQSVENSVAVHVRRGDLSSYNSAYGNPVTSDYFNNAIHLIEEKVDTPYFFFFSDEPEWVKSVLLGQLQLKNNYEVIDVNVNSDTDKGHWDLLLISACDYQISSKGSAGKYGGLLKGYNLKTIIVYDDQFERKVWSQMSDKILFVC